MEKNEKKFKWGWVATSLRMMAQNGQFLVVALVAGFSALMLRIGPWAWAGVAFAAVIFVGAFAANIWMARFDYINGRETFLNDWVAAGATDDERSYRATVWETEGMTVALQMAGVEAMETSGVTGGITANVDGTPMIPGTCVDMNGNTYGVTQMEVGTFHAETGGFNSPSVSYHEPFKMD